MKILVCIKQVPDMESRFKPNAGSDWYEETDLAYLMNEYDEFAVEQAVQLKEKVPDSDLTALSIGPERVKEAIKKALAMGCDRGVHLKDDEYHKHDSTQIASIIAEFARDKGFDLIFTGMQSMDRGSAQVGIYTAEMLGISCLTTLVGFEYDNGTVTAKRELDGGVKAVFKIKTPALLTCQLGLNTPRYPTLPNIIKAKKKELNTVEAGELMKAESAVATEKVYVPEKKGGGLVLEGEAGEIADKLIAILREKTAVLK